MPNPSVETFRASLGRCQAAPSFLQDFYNLFLSSSAEVREKFKNTEFAKQTRILSDSLYIMAVAAESGPDGFEWRELDRLAARHSHADLDVRPTLYDTWLDCLIEAARQHDPQFTAEVEDAWRKTLAPGIERLRSRY